MESYTKSLRDRKNINFKGTIMKIVKCKSKETEKAMKKAMKTRLKKSLKSSNGKNTTILYRGVFFADGTSVFIGMAFSNVKKSPSFSFKAPNVEIETRTRVVHVMSKKTMRKFLSENHHLYSDEVMCIITTSYGIDGELEVNGIFTGDLRGYQLCQVDANEVKFPYEVCNNIATTTKQEVA